MMICDRK